MSWEKIPIPWGESASSLPRERGRYLLWFEPPLVEGSGRYVHFSWVGDSYCVRDYVNGKQTRGLGDLTGTDLWNAAEDRISCTGELYVTVRNHEFWRNKLIDLSERRGTGEGASDKSSLHSQHPSREEHPDLASNDTFHKEPVQKGSDFYREFLEIWADGIGFEIIERTVGCSARYRGEPLLWVYPKYFQVAPKGKGNVHHDEVRLLMDRHFPEIHKGRISFGSDHFTWDRFQDFVSDVKNRIAAIHEHLGDLEDLHLAEQRMINIRAGKSQAVPLEEVMKSYGLEDRA